MGATNTILLDGVALDLDEQTMIVPSFQANDLTQPQNIQADFSPEFSVPSTARNHTLLGYAAYDSNSLALPYRKLRATLLANGVEIIPRAILYIKGYADGRYTLQLFAGNRRFADALGEKMLRELDFSRFDHIRTLGLVADRMTNEYFFQNGWGYELYDRGKGINLKDTNYLDVLPSVSQRLIWQQILMESGFTATAITEPLFQQGVVPATRLATFPKEFREARNVLAGIMPNTIIDSSELKNRDDENFPIPYQDRSADGVPFTVPSAGNFVEGSVSGKKSTAGKWIADNACLIEVEARVVAEIMLADLAGKVSVKIDLYKNALRVQEGSKKITTKDFGNLLQPTTTVSRLEVQPGDEIYAVLRIKFENGVINKYGYKIFTGAVYVQGNDDGSSTNLLGDLFKVTVLADIPPSAPVRLTDYLPDMKQLDFFKGMVQEFGLTVQTDPYEDRIVFSPSYKVLDTTRAVDWTGKRDQPLTVLGTPRSVTYQFGSYAQQNWLRWTEDDTATLAYAGASRTIAGKDAKGYGDGVLVVADNRLEAESVLGTLPFAATENSLLAPDFLLIPVYKRVGDALDPLNPNYTEQDLRPRLVLRGEQLKEVVLRGGTQPAPLSDEASPAEEAVYNQALAAYHSTRTVTIQLSYFAQEKAVELDLERYVLPYCWRGLQAMLIKARFHRERYRLTVQDIANLDYTKPIWDGVLGQYYAVSKINEFSPLRATEVELVRLHHSLLGPPVKMPVVEGKEFAAKEFYVSPSLPSEFY